MISPSKQGLTTGHDGTSLAWQRFGEGSPVLFANGIGVSWEGLADTVEALAQHHTVVTWDYRGLFRSGAPGPAGLSLSAHAMDALAVREAAGLDASAAVVGWSMGAQVAFGVAMRGGARKVVAIGGVPWSPFLAALPVPMLADATPPLLRAAAHFAPLAPPALRKKMPPSLVYQAARAIGYIHPRTERAAFERMTALALPHEGGVYLRTLAGLGERSDREALRHLRCPVLFIAGERDLAVRTRAVFAASSYLPNSRVWVAQGCSHFPTLETPTEVHARILEFLG